MMYETLNAEEKERLKRERERKNSKSMTSKSSGSEGESSSSDSLNKVPLMKMVFCNVDDLEWDVETGKLRRHESDDKFSSSDSEIN